MTGLTPSDSDLLFNTTSAYSAKGAVDIMIAKAIPPISITLCRTANNALLPARFGSTLVGNTGLPRLRRRMTAVTFSQRERNRAMTHTAVLTL